jgi:hypothetical protein
MAQGYSRVPVRRRCGAGAALLRVCGRLAGWLLRNVSTSWRVTRPPAPVAGTWARSTPFSSARRRATGVARSPLLATGGWRAGFGAAELGVGSGPLAAGGVAPGR